MAGQAAPKECPPEEIKAEALRWSIEVVRREVPRGRFRFAIFDFDGTISLIREGWQQIMIP
ncbi:MAG: hypothetical protein LBU19_07080, partial [Treponema sp.]|nr:hypothetical protein [Treponema sp.]